MAINWDNVASSIKEDVFGEKKTNQYKQDERFYKLGRNENEVGGALIRFLPDPDGEQLIKMIKINARQGVNNRFCDEWSPTSIGQKDPFNEKFLELWSAGKKEEAKKFGRSIRFITNIKVIKDPLNPENEGKIFLFEMSETLANKIKDAMMPSEEEMALGTEPKRVYDPVKGNSFMLKIKKGTNKIFTYEDSKFVETQDGIYDSYDEAEKDIEKNAYRLSEFLEPSFYKSYDELLDCLKWYTGEKDKQNADADADANAEDEAPFEVEETPQPKKTKKVTAETPDDDLDALLEDL